MANKITTYLSKQLGKNVTNADFLNTIREMASPNYQADIPKLESLKPINHANVPYTQYEVHQNEFFSILINRIGTTIIKALKFENPLGVFKSETFEHGEAVQEIMVGLAEKKEFDAKSDDSPFKYADTDIHVFYHDLNQERKYTRTIERAWTQKAFTSEHSFDEFIDKMIMSLMTSDEVDEFEAVKAVLVAGLTEVNIAKKGSPEKKVTIPNQKFDITRDDFIVDFNKELIKRSNLFKVPSRTRSENAVGIPNVTPVDEQYLIVSAEFSAELDSMLANAFNMDKATVLANKIIIDEFPTFEGSGDLNGAKPFACLISKKSIILKDKLIEMNHIYNPNTLSFNYFLHHHQLVSYSLLENARIYYTKD